jgi:ATP-dependent DNA helicase RecG
LTVEFKESKHKLSKDALESVCAFLNRDGGHLFLGVSDNSSIVGVDIPSADKIKKEFATAINNLQQLSPTFYLSIQDAMIDGKLILYINVPQSCQIIT